MMGIEASLSSSSSVECLYTRAKTISQSPERTLWLKLRAYRGVRGYKKKKGVPIYNLQPKIDGHSLNFFIHFIYKWKHNYKTHLAVSVQLSFTPRWMSWEVRKQGCPPSKAKPVIMTLRQLQFPWSLNKQSWTPCKCWRGTVLGGKVQMQTVLFQGCTEKVASQHIFCVHVNNEFYTAEHTDE